MAASTELFFAHGFYAARAPHVFAYRGPETVGVDWRPRWEVMGERAAIHLVGRAHVQSNLRGIKELIEPACTVAEAMTPYTLETFPAWSLDAHTGHGASTPSRTCKPRWKRARRPWT